MNTDMRNFLEALARHEGSVAVRSIGIGCTVRQGIARQDARRQGYAVFEAGYWSITVAGRMALLGIAGRRAA